MDEHTNDPPPPEPSGERHAARGVGARLVRPPYRNALVLLAIAIPLAALFVASYSVVLGRPMPRDIPAGIVGDARAQPEAVSQLESATGGALAFRTFDSVSAVRSALGDQSIYAALVLTPGHSQLLLSGASGVSVSRVLQQAADQVSRRVPRPLEIIDVHPLPPSDPQGLVSFYVTLGATILGFLSMFQLRAHAAQLSLREWLAFLVVLAVLGGLALAVVIGPLLGALPAPFAEVWLAASLEIAASALFTSAMLVLFGTLAIIPTWVLFIVMGNTSSGGAVAIPLLPGFFAFVGRYLPPGATVNILHAASYFPAAQRSEPFLVLAVWILGAAVALRVSARLRRRGPTGQCRREL
ncbi:hypothetical protein [Saccharopolyspora shandongensis]|uniref:hypothetical protein n=1 Tax=Saccharopolyspora shandongensis TaxID=418495 RepID=UPI0033E6B64D